MAEGKSLGAFADPKFAFTAVMAPANDDDWRARLAAYAPLRSGTQRLSAVPTVVRSVMPEAAVDILGCVLKAERWPLGAIASGS